MKTSWEHANFDEFSLLTENDSMHWNEGVNFQQKSRFGFSNSKITVASKISHLHIDLSFTYHYGENLGFWIHLAVCNRLSAKSGWDSKITK